jgi:hypothetical protein
MVSETRMRAAFPAASEMHTIPIADPSSARIGDSADHVFGGVGFKRLKSAEFSVIFVNSGWSLAHRLANLKARKKGISQRMGTV